MMKLKDSFWIILFIGIIGIFSYRIFKRALTNYWIKRDPVLTKAVIIDDKNVSPNQPVRPEWSYSYRFTVNGKSYTNNAHDPKLKVGDSVEIEYVKDWPVLNRPLHPND
jgi:hypothetical protein